MIHLDVTKTASARHRSGLTRVTTRLRRTLGAAARPFRWPQADGGLAADDWFLTAELFSEDERPGVTEFLRARRCRSAAIFHDAIPLKHPHITWPRSVARHPGYLKLLAEFDRIFAVSEASRQDLTGFWRWQGVSPRARVDVLPLGADFDGEPRVLERPLPNERKLVSVGILEPRKNQAFLLDVAAALWDEGLGFELHLVGRVNPHFGGAVRSKIRAISRQYPGLRYHGRLDDGAMAALYGGARAALLPTIAEGCGLPLLEALWRGVPCVCSDLPVLRENAGAGGCVPVAVDDLAAWKGALRRVLIDDDWVMELSAAAARRPLPAWADSAAAIRERLEGEEAVA